MDITPITPKPRFMPKLIGKQYSERLDGNLSVAYIETVDEIASLACALFMRDRDEELDTFVIQLNHYDLVGAVESKSLFTTVEGVYLQVQQQNKDERVGTGAPK